MIAASEVSVHAGGRALLDAVDIRIEAGRFHVVLGANGAGKSTLLRVLGGTLKPSAGTVVLAGRPLAHWSARDQARLRAILPQETQLCFGFTALEVVLLGRYPHHGGRAGARDERIALACLEQVDAVHLAQRVHLSLSGGERARVQLARALAQVWEPWQTHPRALLLDEPIAALDIVHQHLTLQRASELAGREGIGVVAVLHDLNLALQYADVTTLLCGGRVFAHGLPVDVITPAALRECFGLDARVIEQPGGDQRMVLAGRGVAARLDR